MILEVWGKSGVAVVGAEEDCCCVGVGLFGCIGGRQCCRCLLEYINPILLTIVINTLVYFTKKQTELIDLNSQFYIYLTARDIDKFIFGKIT